jgi:hypothetical protein
MTQTKRTIGQLTPPELADFTQLVYQRQAIEGIAKIMVQAIFETHSRDMAQVSGATSAFWDAIRARAPEVAAAGTGLQIETATGELFLMDGASDDAPTADDSIAGAANLSSGPAAPGEPAAAEESPPVAEAAAEAPAEAAPAEEAPEGAQAAEPEAEAPEILILLGSSTIGALIDVNGEQVQLGTVVAAAHQRSGMSAADWNALDDATRDGLLNHEVEILRGQATA